MWQTQTRFDLITKKKGYKNDIKKQSRRCLMCQSLYGSCLKRLKWRPFICVPPAVIILPLFCFEKLDLSRSRRTPLFSLFLSSQLKNRIENKERETWFSVHERQQQLNRKEQVSPLRELIAHWSRCNASRNKRVKEEKKRNTENVDWKEKKTENPVIFPDLNTVDN